MRRRQSSEFRERGHDEPVSADEPRTETHAHAPSLRRAQFDAFFASSPLAHALLDASGALVADNPALHTLCANQPARAFSSMADALSRLLRRVEQGQTVVDAPLSFSLGDREVVCAATAFPLHDEAGALSHVALYLRETREPQLCSGDRPRLALEADALRLQAHVLETMREGVCVTSDDGTILYTNPAQERSFGYLPGELLGKHLRVLHTHDTHDTHDTHEERSGEESFAQIAAALREHGEWSGEVTGQKKDGTTIVARVRMSAIEQAEGVRFIRVQDEIELQVEAERERLRTVLMQAPAAISIRSGPEQALTLINPMFQSVSKDAQLGRPLHEVVDDEEIAALSRRTLEVFRTGEAFSVKEMAFPDRDAHGNAALRYFNITYHPLRDAQGKIDSVASFGVEVTEQVAARRRAEALAHQADEANRAKDEFLAMLGHELRNPLAPILTAMDLMRLRDPHVFKKERAVIDRQVRHMVRLVDDLLDVSRITRGKVAIEQKRVDIASCIGLALERASPVLEQHRHHVSVSTGEDLFVLGDEMRLSQVFSNLLTNAAKYTPQAGDISVRAFAVDDEIRVDVEDTGIGIRAEILPHVFDLFVQERQTLARSEGGLGLGLTIVRSLVALHDGRVEVHSAGEGQGSTFSVILPRALATHRAPSDRPPASAPTAPRRVLLVDDNAQAAADLAQALTRRGHVVQVAHDGPSALQTLEAFRPDVAVLDVGLPVMDGYELARRIRLTTAPSAPLLLAVAGYGEALSRTGENDSSFDARLDRPVSLASLLAMLEAHEGTPEA